MLIDNINRDPEAYGFVAMIEAFDSARDMPSIRIWLEEKRDAFTLLAVSRIADRRVEIDSWHRWLLVRADVYAEIKAALEENDP